MKKHLPILMLLLSSLIQAQSFSVYKDDTINRTDTDGKKQGKWLIYGGTKQASCYRDSQVVESGTYLNNRKTGIWYQYYCNGFMKNMLTFKNGRPEGECCMFYSNGALHEDGNWWNARWIGRYTEYDSLGNKIKELQFDTLRKKTSVQSARDMEIQDSLSKRPLQGFHILYNNRKLKSREGVFKDSKLVDGRAYYWDENER
ncbi:MAG: toxin-antitoxin system YwqK family antitoxin, partial [Bacteroidia bacterium]